MAICQVASAPVPEPFFGSALHRLGHRAHNLGHRWGRRRRRRWNRRHHWRHHLRNYFRYDRRYYNDPIHYDGSNNYPNDYYGSNNNPNNYYQNENEDGFHGDGNAQQDNFQYDDYNNDGKVIAAPKVAVIDQQVEPALE